MSSVFVEGDIIVTSTDRILSGPAALRPRETAMDRLSWALGVPISPRWSALMQSCDYQGQPISILFDDCNAQQAGLPPPEYLA